MAVPEQTPYVEYDGNGVSKVFPLTFDCNNSDHLIVLVNDVEPSHGSWSLDATTDTVTFILPPVAGSIIKIQRDTPMSRSTQYQSYNNSFRPASVDDDFDTIWRKMQELGVLNWLANNNIKDLNEYVDSLNGETKAIFVAMIEEQGLSLAQLDGYVDQLYQKLVNTSIEKGWLAEFIAYENTSQQVVNDLLDPKSFPDFYRLQSDIDDTNSFKRLRNTSPSVINLKSGKEYRVTETVILNSACSVNGNGAVFRGTVLPIAPKQMTSVKITADFIKGNTVFKVEDVSKLSVGDKVFLYNRYYVTPWANIDEMLKGIALYKDQLGWTCQMNIISSIDIENGTVTMELPCLEKGSGTLSQIYKIYDDEFNFKDYTVLFDTTQKLGVSYNLACNLSSNVKFKNITNGQATTDTKNLIQIVHNYCYNIHYVGSLADQGTCIHFNYGSTDCSVSYSNFNVRAHSDGGLVTYLGSNNFLSLKNTFKYFDLVEGGVRHTGGAAIYFGAKTRNCRSAFDTITGFHIGIRAMFGAQDASFNSLVALNSKKDVSVVVIEDCQDISFDMCIVDGSLYSVNSNISAYKSSFIIPFLAGSSELKNAFSVVGSIPLKLKLRDCTIGGRLNITAQLIDSDILDCPSITDALIYNSNGFINSKFNGNRCGSVHVRGGLGAQIKGNKIDDTPLRGLTTKRTAGIVLSGQSIVDIDDNDIIHELLGIENQNTNRGLNTAIKLGSNRIKAPVKNNIGITETLSPIVTANNDKYISSEDLYRTDSDAGYWKTIGFSGTVPIWQYYSKSRYIKQIYPVFTFPITANGTHTTTRTVDNASVGDSVIIESGIPPFQGRFYAKVTAANVVTIYYQDLSNTASTINTTVYLTVIK